MRALILLVGASLALSACETTPQKTTDQIGQDLVTNAEYHLTQAVNAYSLAAQAATVAIRNGLLTDDQVRMVGVLNTQAQRAISGVDTGSSIAMRISSLDLIRQQLLSILAAKR